MSKHNGHEKPVTRAANVNLFLIITPDQLGLIQTLTVVFEDGKRQRESKHSSFEVAFRILTVRIHKELTPRLTEEVAV